MSFPISTQGKIAEIFIEIALNVYIDLGSVENNIESSDLEYNIKLHLSRSVH